MSIPDRPEHVYLRDLLHKVLLSEVMTTHPETIEVDDPFHLVEEKMREHRVRHLPVVDISGKLVGIISQRDLFRIRSPRVKPDGTRYYEEETLDGYILQHCMSKNPFTLNPENTLADAILEMARVKYGCIPIVDGNKKVKGVLTRTDIIRAAAEILKRK